MTQQTGTIRPHKGDVRFVKRDKRGRITENRRAKGASKPPKSVRKTGSAWTASQVRELKTLAKENTPTRVIGLKLGRTVSSIASKAKEEGISLKPVNRSPSNRRKTTRKATKRKTAH